VREQSPAAVLAIEVKLTDADLVRGAQRGDAEAWRTLHARYLPLVWRQAYALISDVHAAEDITSETMLALLRSIDRLETDVPKVGGWLRTVVRFKAADHQRKIIRAREVLASSGRATPTCDMASDSPPGSIEAAESREQVLRVLSELSDRQRIVLEWKYLESLGVREMAERLGESEKAVESVLYRARREFRRLYELDVARSTGSSAGPHAPVDTGLQS
jgi:RNA polymerase sigma-70 factor, ECF subfamily